MTDATKAVAMLTVPRELLIRADSLLSLLWHRHVPPTRKDTDLMWDVERTIGDLRNAYEKATR